MSSTVPGLGGTQGCEASLEGAHSPGRRHESPVILEGAHSPENGMSPQSSSLQKSSLPRLPRKVAEKSCVTKWPGVSCFGKLAYSISLICPPGPDGAKGSHQRCLGEAPAAG